MPGKHSISQHVPTTQQQSVSQTSFLDLPAELRNEIYLLCLKFDDDIELVPIRARPNMHPLAVRDMRVTRSAFSAVTETNRRLCPQILRSCRVIHMEASPILYGRNRFRFHDQVLFYSYYQQADLVARFVQQIGTSISYLRHVKIDWQFDHVHKLATLLHPLGQATSLAEISVICGFDGFIDIERDAFNIADALLPLVINLYLQQRDLGAQAAITRILGSANLYWYALRNNGTGAGRSRVASRVQRYLCQALASYSQDLVLKVG